jgi:hypothetical protein
MAGSNFNRPLRRSPMTHPQWLVQGRCWCAGQLSASPFSPCSSFLAGHGQIPCAAGKAMLSGAGGRSFDDECGRTASKWRRRNMSMCFGQSFQSYSRFPSGLKPCRTCREVYGGGYPAFDVFRRDRIDGCHAGWKRRPRRACDEALRARARPRLRALSKSRRLRRLPPETEMHVRALSIDPATEA